MHSASTIVRASPTIAGTRAARNSDSSAIAECSSESVNSRLMSLGTPPLRGTAISSSSGLWSASTSGDSTHSVWSSPTSSTPGSAHQP
ncbi:hypothetical protein [Nannocystis pusilla]|uniref:hypothetical protein n=1 Tax=Nannocystis pusilla TaxID=889268 RepID=UPI003B76B998